MGVTVGIRREDKSEWERRVPIIPEDLARLRHAHNLTCLVQSSPIRVFTDDDFRAAGADIVEDLAPADIVLAVKEIPVAELRPERVYVYFSHTVKGQAYNMPMLRHLLETRATLIDYEKIADEQNRRLIFFSLHAGYAGMIETLWCLGRRLEHLGRRTPLLELRHAYEYDGLADAKAHLRTVGEGIAAHGLGDHTAPLVLGVAGYGNVATGCQEILDCLPVRQIAVADLAASAAAPLTEVGPLVAVTFREEDMVTPRAADAHFVLQDYYQRPENYQGMFERHLPHLDALVNTIYWEERYPRLLTRRWAREQWDGQRQPRLQVVGDISCDIGGSIELTAKAPQPDNPCYVHEPRSGEIIDGVEGNGPVIMSVDNLPCELPREASEHFSRVLRDLVPDLVRADYNVDFLSLHLPPHLKKAVIVHRGELTPDYRYLAEFLD